MLVELCFCRLIQIYRFVQGYVLYILQLRMRALFCVLKVTNIFIQLLWVSFPHSIDIVFRLECKILAAALVKCYI